MKQYRKNMNKIQTAGGFDDNKIDIIRKHAEDILLGPKENKYRMGKSYMEERLIATILAYCNLYRDDVFSDVLPEFRGRRRSQRVRKEDYSKKVKLMILSIMHFISPEEIRGGFKRSTISESDCVQDWIQSKYPVKFGKGEEAYVEKLKSIIHHNLFKNH